MLCKKNIYYLLSVLLLCFSGCFTANISRLSPIYFSILLIGLLIIGSTQSIVLKKVLHKNMLLIAFVNIFILYIVLQMVVSDCFESIFDYILYLLSFLYLIGGVFFFPSLDLLQVKKIIKLYFWITSMLLFFDFLYRILHRESSFLGLLFFYNFKLNGIMFRDSNFSGFLAMINFCFALYLRDKKILKINFIAFFILFILVIVNFSRAAILTCLFMMGFSWFNKLKLKTKLYLSFFIIVLLVGLTLLVLDYFSNDYSLKTKFEIFSSTLNYLKYMDVKQFFFGNGIFSSPEILGRSGHNYIAQTIVEFGMVIFSFQILLFIIVLFITKNNGLYIILPYLIAGLAMTPLCMPYFYVICSIIILFEEGGFFWN